MSADRLAVLASESLTDGSTAVVYAVVDARGWAVRSALSVERSGRCARVVACAPSVRPGQVVVVSGYRRVGDV